MRAIITRILTCIAVLLCIHFSASAYDFEMDGIYYTILSDSESTCEVSKGYGEYTGDVEIPSVVTFEAHQYLVTKIASNAFVGCSSITSVTLPNSVSESLFGVFADCCSLAEISVAQDNPNYSSIDGVLFNKNCTELIAYPNAKGSEYTIPDSVMFIGILAFAYCNDLISVTISDSVTVISTAAFYRCSYLTDVKFGNSIISIRDAAFAYCYSLASVTLPNSVRLIEREAFSSCINLTEVTIGDSDSNGNAGTEIGYNAFSDCTSLKTLTIGNSVTKIGACAFSGCTALTNVNISDSVTEIESSAFIGCSSLAIVTIGNSVSNIGGGAFAYCSSLAEISVAQDNPYYYSIDGVLFNKDCTELIAYPNAKGSEYIIPDSVISIGHQAFLACHSLAYVTIPNSITEIGEQAFWECNSLISVTIPDSVTEIQSGAFLGCKSLTSLTISGNITEIGELAFALCENLTYVYYNCKEPIEIDDLTIFVNCLEEASLYVPEVAVEKCKITAPWKYFKNIVAYDFSGVETVSGDAEKIVTGRYDVSGSSVDEEYKGLVIVRYTDGSTQKILQK